jgi:hypothetical protein
MRYFIGRKALTFCEHTQQCSIKANSIECPVVFHEVVKFVVVSIPSSNHPIPGTPSGVHLCFRDKVYFGGWQWNNISMRYQIFFFIFEQERRTTAVMFCVETGMPLMLACILKCQTWDTGTNPKNITRVTYKCAYLGISNYNFGHPICTVIIEHSQQKPKTHDLETKRHCLHSVGSYCQHHSI